MFPACWLLLLLVPLASRLLTWLTRRRRELTRPAICGWPGYLWHSLYPNIMANQNKPQTMITQLFTGFFLVYWAAVACLAYKVIRQAVTGQDWGAGPLAVTGGLLVAAVVIPVVVNYFQSEQRAKRNG